VGEGKTVKRRAHVVDRSALGLRIKTTTALTPGRTVVVIFKYAEPCRVVWTGKAGSKHKGQAGLEFLRAAASG